MTENCGTFTKCIPNNPTDGGAMESMQLVNKIGLVNVSRMDYTPEDIPYPHRRICIRGANRFSDYYKCKLHCRTYIRWS